MQMDNREEMPDPKVPDDLKPDEKVQPRSEGTGALYHRLYRVDVDQPQVDLLTLMQQIKSDPNAFTPIELARFEKTKGDPDRFEIGDEYYIHITGPWDGPVRVLNQIPTAFTFITLTGHLEAGEIHFRLLPHPAINQAFRFEIESWARSADKIVELFYEANIAKTAQTGMWTGFCEQVVIKSGGEMIGNIEIITQRAPYEEGESQHEGD
jgi:hypothetical protein